MKDWRAWRIRFTAWLAGVDDQFDFCLRAAENRGTDAIAFIDQNVKHLDRFLFIQLIGLVQGEYLDLILEAPFGFEAWRKLCMEFEHLTAGRKLLAIEELLHPDFGDEASWRSCWLNWERAMERCAIQTGLHLPDDVKIAIVRRRAPDALRQHLQLTASSYEGRYPVFHDFVDAFWKARQGCEEDTSYSMDVSYMTDKGSAKGKSKGQLGLWQPRRQDKGLGKGSSAKGSTTKGSQKQKDLDKSRSKCFFCGRKGHTSAECRTGRVCYNCKKPGTP